MKGEHLPYQSETAGDGAHGLLVIFCASYRGFAKPPATLNWSVEMFCPLVRLHFRSATTPDLRQQAAVESAPMETPVNSERSKKRLVAMIACTIMSLPR